MKALISTLLTIFFIISSGWSQYQVEVPLIAGGAIIASSVSGTNNYEVSATAGEVAVDFVSNSQYIMNFGFWHQYQITGIENVNDLLLPKVFDLRQNYPNPFNPVTTIEYALPRVSEVTIEIYNILGQQVTKLVNEKQPAGYYNVRWRGLNSSGSYVANGVYFYRMVAQSVEGKLFVKTKKMLFLK